MARQVMKRAQEFIEYPLKVVGGNNKGRYPIISSEATFNMIVSDGWLVPFAGHKAIANIDENGLGRGIFYSTRSGRLIVVINNKVYSLDSSLSPSLISVIDTYTGDVFIDENDAKQIAICDKKDIYIYDYSASSFAKASLDFIPGYITFQNGYFISAQQGQPKWRLSDLNNGLNWPASPNKVGTFQTKPDDCVACVRFPGKGNQLFVMGKTVSEIWVDVGYQIFPYQRSSTINIDYGCINASTIACSDTFICWLGVNEKSGPVILVSAGGEVQQISDEGTNFKLASLNHPELSYGFLYKQDGHLLYQVTFYDASDNVTFVYDFLTKEFFFATDEYDNYHIAKKAVYFNNKYYFISINDGYIYETNSTYTTYNGNEIPRIRVCNHIRTKDSSRFIIDSLSFVLEQGSNSDPGRIDLAMSYDGGATFGNYVGHNLKPIGERKNIFQVFKLGSTNDLVPKIRFWGHGRFIAYDGVVRVYQ